MRSPCESELSAKETLIELRIRLCAIARIGKTTRHRHGGSIESTGASRLRGCADRRSHHHFLCDSQLRRPVARYQLHQEAGPPIHLL